MASSTGVQNSPSTSGTANNQGAEELVKYMPLLNAAVKGDWRRAQTIIRQNPDAMLAKITTTGDTALSVAASQGHAKFVEELTMTMPPASLCEQNNCGETVLFLVAATGITKMAEVLVKQNEDLLQIKTRNGSTPLSCAALFGHKEMVWYLYSVTSSQQLDPKTSSDGYLFLYNAVQSELYDVALHVIKWYPELAIPRDDNEMTALMALAFKSSSFPSRSRMGFWQRSIYPYVRVDQMEEAATLCYIERGDLENAPVISTDRTRIIQVFSSLHRLFWNAIKLLVPGMKAIHDSKLIHIQAFELVKLLLRKDSLSDELQFKMTARVAPVCFIALQMGIVEIITESIRSYPYLIWFEDRNGRNLLLASVASRQEKIFNLLIHEIGAPKHRLANTKDKWGNSMLHITGKLAPSRRLKSVSGPALQMQRELQWFKEVEKIVQPAHMEMNNSKGKKPRELFTEEHKDLVKDGEEWMKGTASSCMVVATLIATVMFAAGFTVPGGNNSEKGTPIFLHTVSFIIFAVSDTLSLFSSTTSVLMFLSILTSRFAEEDFLHSLPKRLIIGLATLFFSIATMMVAFCVTIVIMLEDVVAWVAIPVILLACVPVTSFAFDQFPLFLDMVRSTYGSGIFHSQSKYNFVQ